MWLLGPIRVDPALALGSLNVLFLEGRQRQELALPGRATQMGLSRF